MKTGTVTINVKSLTGFKDTYEETTTNTVTGEKETVKKENKAQDVSFKVSVNGKQITRNGETVKENETAKTVSVSGQGTIEIEIVIDGATKTCTMDLDKTATKTIDKDTI